MRRVVMAVIVLMCASLGRAQDVVNGELGAEIDKAVRGSTLGQFWGAVLVARDGQILLAKGYGVANESLAGNTAHSLFDIGSVTKCFTSAAILKLEQDGKLSLEDSITKFYPNAPAEKKAITLKHLMTHTSGLAQEGAENAYAKGDIRDSVAEGLLKADQEASPGTVFQYSNAGYFILAAVVEKASGTTWERYVTDTLMRPAGMKMSGCCGDKTLKKELLTARQDRQWRTDGDAATWPYPLTWGYRGAGGVVSSVIDMYAWDRALRADAVLSAGAREKMFTPALEGYALGWEVEQTPQGRISSHTGGVRGYATAITRWLDKDVCIVVLTNEKNNLMGIMKLLTEKVFPSTVETTTFTAELAGYKLGEHGNLVYPDSLVLESSAGKEEGSVRIVAKEPGKEKPALIFGLSPGAASVFIAKLEAAIDSVKARGAKEDAKGMNVEVFTIVYRLAEGEALVREGEGLTLEAKAGTMHPEEGGNKKVLVFVKDEARSMLPMFMKLERGRAEELLAGLKKATGK